jgi:probable F420-dependent oxidoreductase
MRVGLALPVAPELNAPAVLRSLVRAAEEAGYDSLWVSDHLLLPRDGFISHGHQPDPLAMLGWLAAATERVGIGTSVLVLPYRDPAVVAKVAGTADSLSGGRVRLGVGAGWLKEEFDALGVPFGERGERTDAALRTLRSLWADDGDMSASPTGAPGHAIPLLVGGNSPPAVRRAIRLGDGWQPLNLTPQALGTAIGRYRAAAPDGYVSARVHPRRLEHAGGAPLTGTPAEIRAGLAAYAAAGADELVVSFGEDGGPDAVLARWTAFAEAAGLP